MIRSKLTKSPFNVRIFKKKGGVKLKKMDEKLLAHLKREKAYDQILYLFGRKTYWENTPLSYQVQELRRFLSEGNETAMMEKYGPVATKILGQFINKKEFTSNDTYLKNNLKAGIVTILLVLTFIKTGTDIVFIKAWNNIALKGIEMYSEDEEIAKILESYDESIGEYAEYIDSLQLDDLETIVKVIDDMWNNIEGYSLDVEGYTNELAYNRLALYTLGYGNCKHMADDFTARMNAINPAYNAYNMIVYLKEVAINNTKRTILNSEDPTSPAQEENAFDKALLSLLKHSSGNHVVSCITLPNTNIKLVVDPTNPSIGLLRNGKVVILTENRIEDMDITISNIGVKMSEKDELASYLKDYFSSYLPSVSLNDLISNYGTAAQNETLSELQSKYDSSHYELALDSYEDTPETNNTVEYDAGPSMIIKPIKK